MVRYLAKGILESQYMLGCRYWDGNGIEKNTGKAVKWWEKAAERGHPKAQYSLGRVYDRKVDGNRDKANYWYKKAADQGDADAQYRIGKLSEDKDKKVAFEWYLQAAKQGHLEAIDEVSSPYLAGGRGPKEALKWLQLCAEKEKTGNALWKVARVYHEGSEIYEVIKDYEKAFEWYQKLKKFKEKLKGSARSYSENADDEIARFEKEISERRALVEKATAGNKDAQYELGEKLGKRCLPGDRYQSGFPPDKKASMEWLHKAAEQGHIKAQLRLAHEYLEGNQRFEIHCPLGNTKPKMVNFKDLDNIVVQQDKKLACEWFQRAADQGEPNAQYALGKAYEKGEGVIQDKKTACEWYQKAALGGGDERAWLEERAKKEDSMAQMVLGALAAKAQAEFQDLLKRAATGDKEAQLSLVDVYSSGKGVVADMKVAREWLHRAAEQGHPIAQNRLGDAYRLGNYGVTKDVLTACAWYRKAAQRGNADAKARLEEMAKAGVIEAQEALLPDVCQEWLEKARTGDAADAHYHLGEIYGKGQGVPKNLNEAAVWYRKAAEQGHAKAQNEFGFASWEGRGVQKNHSIAVGWFRKAAEQGQARAQFNLGYALEIGDGVAKDEKESAEWYRKAAEQGDADAQFYFGTALEESRGVRRI